MSIFISKSEGPKSRVFKNKILFENKSLKVTLLKLASDWFCKQKYAENAT